MFSLFSLNSRTLYRILVDRLVEESGSILKLKEKYNWNDTIISKLFLLPYRSTLDCRLRSFHYRVMNNILFLNRFIFYKLSLCDTPLCSFCKGEEETLDHFFFYCPITSNFWSSIYKRLNFAAFANPSEGEIVYGFHNLNAGGIENVICLSGKYYLFRMRLRHQVPNITQFISFLKVLHQIE